MNFRQDGLDGPRSEEVSYALFHHDYAVFCASGAGFMLEELQRFVDWFVREAERAVVHGDHPSRFEVEESAHGVGRIGVDIAELRRIIGADGEQREFGGKATSDFTEAGKICRVAGVINRVFASFHDKAAIAAVRIFQNAGTPMARWNMSDRNAAAA